MNKLETYILLDHSDAISFIVHTVVLEKKIFKEGYPLESIFSPSGAICEWIWTK